MNQNQKRLRTIELSLTPRQIVLLWLASAAKGMFMNSTAAMQSPRGAIANSVWSAVRDSMKGQTDSIVEHAVRQARQEADMLYHLALIVNDRVLTSTSQRDREFFFVAQYLRGITYINLGPHSEGEIRKTALTFVEEVFLLDGAVSQICAEYFGGQPILFSDSVQQLKHQLDLANVVLKCFDLLVKKLEFKELTEKSVRETLEEDIASQASLWMRLARIQTLVDFGNEAECRVAYSDFNRESSTWRARQVASKKPNGKRDLNPSVERVARF